ncbi:MAG: hypothetical protein JO253_06910, partial [Alphaproteobacteria bacterium]|nr:hypothetical protein [Alphaproteobacteria bacterium]
MYMLVFITLVIGLINIYAQILTVQTQRLAARQVGLARTMQQWQTAAISMANSIYYENGTPATTSGCSLSINVPAGLAVCAPPVPGVTGDAAGTVTAGGNVLNMIVNHNTNATECVHLPSVCTAHSGINCTSCKASYDAADYQYYSIYVKDNTTHQSFVVTFVPPPTISASNPAPGFLTLAGGYQTSQTQADLMQQFVNAFVPNYTYGIVNGRVLKVAGA